MAGGKSLARCVAVLSLCTLFAVAAGQKYTAAAVSMVPRWKEGTPPLEVMRSNVEAYRQWIEESAEMDADIVVFPEGSNGYLEAVGRGGVYERRQATPFASQVPAVSNGAPYINPCEEGLEGRGLFNWAQLVNVSCMARSAQVVVVVTLVDVQPCEGQAKCPTDGVFQYNAAVAFAEDGHILAVFHKNHLSGTAPVLDQPARPPRTHPAYFDTSFGVRFGLLTCQDMTFNDSASMYTQLGIHDIIFPTRWSNLLPVVISPQLDQSFAIQQRSNIIAANQAVDFRNSGSALISKSGAVLAHDYDPAQHDYESILIADFNADEDDMTLPPPVPAFDDISAVGRDDVCLFLGVFKGACARIDPTVEARGAYTVTAGDFTCEARFNISSAPGSGELWALVALAVPYNGTHDIDPFYTRMCAVMRCNAYPQCLSYHAATSTVVGQFELHARGDGFANPPLPTGEGQVPSDMIWSVAAVRDGQMMQGEEFSLENGGRTIRSRGDITDPLFSVSINGLSYLQPRGG